MLDLGTKKTPYYILFGHLKAFNIIITFLFWERRLGVKVY